ILCASVPGWAGAADDEETADAPEYSRGVKQCMACHREGRELAAHEIFYTPMGITGDPDSPFAEGNHDCEACHGPSAQHTRRKDGVRPPPTVTFDEKNTVEEKNAPCLSCHNDRGRFHWPGSAHDVEGVACVDCHDLHTPNDPVLSVETQPEVCYQCHKETRAQFLRQSRHPVEGAGASMSHIGLLSCTDCHQPHGSAGPANLVRNTVNEQCYDCHAEKRGPFLFEHAPVQEDCTNCHVPHGSNYENLLVARQPYLCQQCHLSGYHVNTVYGGNDVPPFGADQRMLGKQCMNCHAEVHGSNHPGGVRQTR
ncbi:MAG: DmsE family decaheme c-type cytochrome, partial [Lysobacterales bacterium]